MGSEKRGIILDVGKEQSFREVRHRLLVDAGYEVLSTASVAEAEKTLKGKRVEAAVVGARVTKTERDQVVRSVKASNPDAKIIFYYDQTIDGTEEADAILNFRGDHSDLVRTIQHLLAKATKAERGSGATAGRLRNLAVMLVSAAGYLGDRLGDTLVMASR